MGAAILQLRSELQARFDLPLGIVKDREQKHLATGIEVVDRLKSAVPNPPGAPP
jgi:hypothetical protein